MLTSYAFIQVIRDSCWEADLYQRLLNGEIWFPPVVALELAVGVHDRDECRGLPRLVQALGRQSRVLTSAHLEGVVGGRLITLASRNHEQLCPHDHVADALIALVVARLGGTVPPAKVAHVERWAALVRDSGQDVTMTPFSPAPT